MTSGAKTTVEKPEDFDSYWDRTMDDLSSLPPAPELEVMHLRSTDFATTYGLKLTSLGPYRIFAYFTVPHGDGPFPARYYVPTYASVMHIPPYEDRKEFVTLALCHRGMRLADKPFAAAFPGLLTVGVDDKETYVYRGIVADSCRALDFLLSRPEVDKSRVFLSGGGDLALSTAALRPQVRAAVCNAPKFYAARHLIPLTDAYPLEEINDYVRSYPEKEDVVYRTLSYFDPLFFAPRIKADVLLQCGMEGALFSQDNARPLIEALGAGCEVRVDTGLGYTEYVFAEEWIRQRIDG